MRLAIFTLVYLALCLDVRGAIAFKSITSSADSAASLTISNGTSANVATDDLIVVIVSHGGNIANATGVACGSNTLTRAVSSTYSTENFGLEAWYKSGAVAGATTTCTATWATQQTYRVIVVAVYSGIATSSPIDVSSCNESGCASITTNATNRTAQNVTTTQADDLLVWASVDWFTHNWTAANSFNLRLSTTGTDYMLADKIISSTGVHPNGNVATVTDEADDKYLSVFVAFKAAGSSGGGVVRRRTVISQ